VHIPIKQQLPSSISTFFRCILLSDFADVSTQNVHENLMEWRNSPLCKAWWIGTSANATDRMCERMPLGDTLSSVLLNPATLKFVKHICQEVLADGPQTYSHLQI
jgi:hypothetical protein